MEGSGCSNWRQARLTAIVAAISITRLEPKPSIAMNLTRNDWRVQRLNFDLSQPMNLLRVACGAFLIPHVWGKFAGGVPAPGVVGFFAKAGLTPPEFWVYVAAAVELGAGVALVLGVCTRWAAFAAALLLAVAVYSLQVVKGFGWWWNVGGFEFLVFWIVCCLVVAMDSWQKEEAR
jgi:putative oxidoreductase